jgi:hypothetical protein
MPVSAYQVTKLWHHNLKIEQKNDIRVADVENKLALQ